MAIVKPDLSQQWASEGGKIAPSGAKIQAGWGPEIPPYQWENFIQNRQDEMLAYLNERGIPEWDNRTNYVGGGKSYVQGSDGKVYKSVAASGPDGVVSNPAIDVTDTYWTIAFADAGVFLTQTAGDGRYTQRSNNLSDLTNVTTARTNLGVVSATATQAGLLEIATTSEVLAGVDATRAVTPAGLVAGLLGTSVLSGDGYFTLPVKVSGVRKNLIIQYMNVVESPNASTERVWPISFPTTCVWATATPSENISNAGGVIIGISATGIIFTVGDNYAGGTPGYVLGIGW